MGGISSQQFDTIRSQDYPVCAAQMCMGLYGWGPDLEHQEHFMANMCKNMAKTVFVDSKKRYVFVGEDPDIPDSGLIEYTDEIQQTFSNSFFIQWDIYHSLVLDFSVVGFKMEPIFCIRGLWSIDKWSFMDVYPSSSITVISSQGKAG
jgi:hypothetical protein